jgi:CHAT domain
MPNWFDAFDTANCEADGERLLLEHSSDLNDAIAGALNARADALRKAGDSDGADEFQSWAGLARAIATKRDLLATDIIGIDDGAARLRAVRERLDTAFATLCLNDACRRFGELQRTIEDKNLEAAQAIAAQIGKRAEFEIGFLRAAARFGESRELQGYADLANGCWRQLLAGVDLLRGDSAGAETIRKDAETSLAAAAVNDRLSVKQRAGAENNLATLSYPDLEKVKQHQSAALDLAEAAGDWLMARNMRRHLAHWARQDGDWQRVVTLLDKNLKAAEKAVLNEYAPQLVLDLVEDTRPDVEEFVNGCFELGKRDPAYWQRAVETIEWGKSRAHLRASMVMATSYGNVPQRLNERLQRLKAMTRDLGNRMAMLPLAVAERQKAGAEQLLRLTGEVESQIEKFGKRRAYDLSCFPVSFAEMVKTIPARATVLCFFQQRGRVLIFVLGAEGLRGEPVEAPVTSETVARALVQIEVTSAMRANFASWDAIQTNIDMQIDAIYPMGAMNAMYQAFIAPVADRIRESDVVYISPDRSLLRIPLHAVSKVDGTALIDEVPVAYTPGFAVLRRALRAEQRSSEQPVFAAGVAKDKGGPGCAGEEAATVARFFGAAPETATREAVSSRGMNSRVLHISCHTDSSSALTNDRGLQLEDGMFGMDDIHRGSPRASLVFLSACDTSGSDLLGYGKELIGFVGAFMRCGVPSVVATMWKMPENVSVPLVEAFYAELVKNQTSPAVALQRAIQSIKRQERFAHPYFWASICLYGAA